MENVLRSQLDINKKDFQGVVKAQMRLDNINLYRS